MNDEHTHHAYSNPLWPLKVLLIQNRREVPHASGTKKKRCIDESVDAVARNGSPWRGLICDPNIHVSF